MTVTLSLAVVALLVSAVLTAVVRRFALTLGVLDIPNDRSSHNTVTPRGGGLAIVVTMTAAALVLAWLGVVPMRLLVALVGGGLAVAVIGFVDDRYTVRAAVRLTVHLSAALWAVYWLDGLPPLRLFTRVAELGWSGYVLATLGIMWTLNLFNFMDGIDSIAASEAVFVACAGAILSSVGVDASGISVLALVFAGACGGFLLWNWPPAKIFMGDVGSGYLGYVLALLALRATHDNPSAVWVWLILGSVFFVDATVTLVRRTLRWERVHEAHRSHAYQWLARGWRSHRRVTLWALAINVFWLLPCAVLATRFPSHSLWLLLIAQAPLIVTALVAGAGRRETATVS